MRVNMSTLAQITDTAPGTEDAYGRMLAALAGRPGWTLTDDGTVVCGVIEVSDAYPPIIRARGTRSLWARARVININPPHDDGIDADIVALAAWADIITLADGHADPDAVLAAVAAILSP